MNSDPACESRVDGAAELLECGEAAGAAIYSVREGCVAREWSGSPGPQRAVGFRGASGETEQSLLELRGPGGAARGEREARERRGSVVGKGVPAVCGLLVLRPCALLYSPSLETLS